MCHVDQVLDLSYNNLSSTDVFQLRQIQSLVTLDITGNNLQNLSDETSHPVVVREQSTGNVSVLNPLIHLLTYLCLAITL